jgi:hypothetical protein
MRHNFLQLFRVLEDDAAARQRDQTVALLPDDIGIVHSRVEVHAEDAEPTVTESR